MRNLILAITASAMLVLAYGCSEEIQSEPASSVELSTDLLSSGPEGQRFEVTVTSSEDWRISGLCDWIEISAESGKSGDVLVLNVAPNEGPESRSMEFKVFAGSAVAGLEVVSYPEYKLDLDQMEIKSEFTSDGGLLKIRLATNIPELEYSFTENGSDWIEFVRREDVYGTTYMVFNVSESEIYTGRKSELTISGEGKNISYSVSQKQLDAVLAEETNYVVGLDATTLEIKVRTNVDIKCNVPGWITLDSETRGEEGSDGLSAIVYRFILPETDGTRAGNIVFSSEENVTLSVRVKQQNPNPVYTVVDDQDFLDYLLDKGYVIFDDEVGKCELTGTGLSLETISVNKEYFEKVSGLGAFPLLTRLEINSPYISVLDLSDCTGIKDIDITTLNGATEIRLGKNPVTSLVFSKNPNSADNYHQGTSLLIEGENLESIDFQSASFRISSGWDSCATLDVTGCPALKYLNAKREYLSYCSLKTIFMTSDQLAAVEVTKSDKTTIEVSE